MKIRILLLAGLLSIWISLVQGLHAKDLVKEKIEINSREIIKFNKEHLLNCDPGSSTYELFDMSAILSVTKLENGRCELVIKTPSIKFICDLSEKDRVSFAKEAIAVGEEYLLRAQEDEASKIKVATPISDQILSNGSCIF